MKIDKKLEAKKEELGLITYTFVRTLEDYDAYVTISNKKPSMVNRFQKILLNKLTWRLNNE